MWPNTQNNTINATFMNYNNVEIVDSEKVKH